MRFINKVADWYEESGWRTLRIIAIVFGYINLFLFTLGSLVAGLVLAVDFEDGWLFVAGLGGALIHFFIYCFLIGVMKGDLQLLDSLVNSKYSVRITARERRVANWASKTPIVNAAEPLVQSKPQSAVEERRVVSFNKVEEPVVKKAINKEGIVVTRYFAEDTKGEKIRVDEGTQILVVESSEMSGTYIIEYKDGEKIHRIENVPSFYLKF